MTDSPGQSGAQPAGSSFWQRAWVVLWGLPLAILGALGVKLAWMGQVLSLVGFPFQRVPVSATLAVVAMIGAIALLLPGRWPLHAAICVNVVLTALALANMLADRFYGDVLSLAELRLIGQWRLFGPSAWALVRWGDVVYLADVLVVIAMLVCTRGRLTWRPAAGGPTRGWAPALLGVAAVLAAVPAIRLVSSDPEEVFGYAFQRKEVVSAVGLLPYHIYDLVIQVSFPLRGRLSVAAGDPERVVSFLESQHEGRNPAPLTGVAAGRNVILVSVESLQSFVLGLELDGQAIAPNLTAFARESVDFVRFFDQTHMGSTADAELLALGSLYPLAAGAVATRFSANEFRALPHVLGEHGYATISACAQPSSFWNMRQMHERLGFQRSLFAPQFRSSEWLGIGLADKDFFPQVASHLDSVSEPFLAYLITSTSHYPYELPAHHRQLSLGALEGTLLGNYLQSIRYVDEAFGGFLAQLRQSGLLDRSVVAIFGDHNAWLQDSVELQALSAAGRLPRGRVLGERVRWWQTVKSVPFLVRLPLGQWADRLEVAGGSLDVAPTIAALVGVRSVPVVWLGSDLGAGGPRVVVFRDGSLIARNTLQLPRGAGCHDLATGVVADCESVRGERKLASEALAVSDLLISGNLVRQVTHAAEGPFDAAGWGSNRFLVIAHRGDSLSAPENTMAAIVSALDVGADAIEVDLHRSRDGVIVVFHDDTLERTTSGSGTLAALTFNELRLLDAGSWMHPRFAGERIATLEEVLVATKDRARLLLDLKAEGLGQPVAALYRRHGIDPTQAFIGAWTPAQRENFRLHMPGALILRTEVPPGPWDGTLFDRERSLGIWGFEVGDVWPVEFVAAARAHGMPVIAYTVNEAPTMRRLIEMGVRGIETDDPALLLTTAKRARAP